MVLVSFSVGFEHPLFWSVEVCERLRILFYCISSSVVRLGEKHARSADTLSQPLDRRFMEISFIANKHIYVIDISANFSICAVVMPWRKFQFISITTEVECIYGGMVWKVAIAKKHTYFATFSVGGTSYLCYIVFWCVSVTSPLIRHEVISLANCHWPQYTFQTGVLSNCTNTPQ